MQGNFVKRFLISTTAVALAMAWAVVPLSQAQPQEMQEEYDLAPAPSVPISQAQSREMQGLGMKKTLQNPKICHSERNEESGNLRLEHSRDSSHARNDKELVKRKPCREMDDSEMDGMCGGITGSFDMTDSGNMVLNDNSVQSIALSDQAQQNLTSLVNIISINSTIQVMLNLNVNINSTVGTVNQGNTGTQNTGVQNTLTTGH